MRLRFAPRLNRGRHGLEGYRRLDSCHGRFVTARDRRHDSCFLTPEPGGDRSQEVIVCQELLQTMGLSSFTPLVTACPGCGRTTSTFFQELANSIQSHLRTQMPTWRERFIGVEEMNVAVMGCVVNGPGGKQTRQRWH